MQRASVQTEAAAHVIGFINQRFRVCAMTHRQRNTVSARTRSIWYITGGPATLRLPEYAQAFVWQRKWHPVAAQLTRHAGSGRLNRNRRRELNSHRLWRCCRYSGCSGAHQFHSIAIATGDCCAASTAIPRSAKMNTVFNCPARIVAALFRIVRIEHRCRPTDAGESFIYHRSRFHLDVHIKWRRHRTTWVIRSTPR